MFWIKVFYFVLYVVYIRLFNCHVIYVRLFVSLRLDSKLFNKTYFDMAKRFIQFGSTENFDAV
jgi:hypothetical protein